MYAHLLNPSQLQDHYSWAAKTQTENKARQNVSSLNECNASRPVEISENLTLSLMSISLTLSLAKTEGSIYVRLNRLLLSCYFINPGK